MVLQINAQHKKAPDDVVMTLMSLGIERGLSIIEIAELVGVSRQAVYEWIDGSYKPKNFVVARINKVIETLQTKG